MSAHRRAQSAKQRRGQANTSSSIQSESTASWQWSTRTGWQNYSDTNCSRLTIAHLLEGHAHCEINVEEVGIVTVDFDSMVQTVRGGHRPRNVRYNGQVAQTSNQKDACFYQQQAATSKRRESTCPPARCGPSAAKESSHYSNFAPPACHSNPSSTDQLSQIVHPLLKDLELPRPSDVAAAWPHCRQLRIPISRAGTVAFAMEIAEDIRKIAGTDSGASSSNMKYSGSPCIQLSMVNSGQCQALMAGISMYLFLSGAKTSSYLPKFVMGIGTDAEALGRAWKDWAYRSHHLHDAYVRPLSCRLGSFDWLRFDNSPQSRDERWAAAAMTLRYGFSLHGFDNLIASTKLLPLEEYRNMVKRSSKSKATAYYKDPASPLDLAVEQKRQGKKVAVVSAASAFQVGGGFLTGGRHALEEAICMQSTLFFSLQQAKRLAADRELKDIISEKIRHIPERGAVLSPDVSVFRKGTASGYELMERPVKLDAIISVAMPNKNPNVRDSPVDYRDEYSLSQLMRDKFDSVLLGAASVKAEVLIVPDVGCGVFKNDPRSVAKAFGAAMRNFETKYGQGVFEKVIFTGCDEFKREGLDACNEGIEVSRRSESRSFCLRPFGMLRCS